MTTMLLARTAAISWVNGNYVVNTRIYIYNTVLYRTPHSPFGLCKIAMITTHRRMHDAHEFISAIFDLQINVIKDPLV